MITRILALKVRIYWRLIGLFGLSFLGSMLLFRGLFVYRLAEAQVVQLSSNLSQTISLSELALENYPPQAVARLSGYRILVGFNAPMQSQRLSRVHVPVDGLLHQQVMELRELLCQRLGHCPEVVAASAPDRGAWIRLASPLDQVWMFSPLPLPGLVSLDPLVLSLSLLSGAGFAVALFFWFEIHRPMTKLERAMAQVGTDSSMVPPAPSLLPQSGLAVVTRLVDHFSAMLHRIAANELERQTLLAGIAHDLNSPITRLRLRLTLLESGSHGGSVENVSGNGNPLRPILLGADDFRKLHGDLDALGRITQQFLLLVGSGSDEPYIQLPLADLLWEVTAPYEACDLRLDVVPLTAAVQPLALGRAILNLVDNAISYGRPPFEIQLRRLSGESFCITVIDHGNGIPDASIKRALEPFYRLDPARGGEGHCGLGLTIVQRIATMHGGSLELGPVETDDGLGFGASLIGRCDAANTELLGSSHD